MSEQPSISAEEGVQTNLRWWDEAVPLHVESEFYGLDSFLEGRCSLLPIELDSLGDVSGLSLLHLQCHFGMDTLSWARRGAQVTGIDFSGAAVAKATEISELAGLEAQFVQCDVCETPQALPGQTFDLVFTSWGVLCWLPDLAAWARAAAAMLSPGGRFFIAEFHPTMLMFDGPAPHTRKYGYFRGPPIKEQTEGTYAVGDRMRNDCTVEWTYELGQVVTALVNAGLQILNLQEYDATACEMPPGLMKHEDGLWRQPEGELKLPLSFSILATKPL